MPPVAHAPSAATPVETPAETPPEATATLLDSQTSTEPQVESSGQDVQQEGQTTDPTNSQIAVGTADGQDANEGRSLSSQPAAALDSSDNAVVVGVDSSQLQQEAEIALQVSADVQIHSPAREEEGAPGSEGASGEEGAPGEEGPPGGESSASALQDPL